MEDSKDTLEQAEETQAEEDLAEEVAGQLPEDLNELLDLHQQLQREHEAMKDRFLRAAAEMDNMRKRTAQKIETERRLERQKVLNAFLEVEDNLERALAAHEGEESTWVEGTRAIYKQILDTLTRFGARPMECRGEAFDPNRHDAVSRIQLPDAEDGSIVEVLQTGYEFEDGSVLRPARVVVGYRE